MEVEKSAAARCHPAADRSREVHKVSSEYSRISETCEAVARSVVSV